MKLKFTSRSLILCLALLFLPLGWAFAQQVQTPGYESGSAGTDLAATPIPLTPIPLTRLRDSAGQTANTAVKPSKESSLRRFVTIGFGALPFLFFYTNLAFDVTEFAASGFDLQYAPWPIQNRFSSLPLSEQMKRIGIAASVSLAIAVLDAVFPSPQRK